MKKLLVLCLIVLGIMVVWQLNKKATLVAQPNVSTVVVGNTATIAMGQTKTINGVSITLNDIVADYRCPIDVTCIEAGAIVANVTFKVGDEVKTFNMPSDEVPQTFVGYTVVIGETTPPARAKVTIDQNQYVVQFTVEKAL